MKNEQVNRKFIISSQKTKWIFPIFVLFMLAVALYSDIYYILYNSTSPIKFLDIMLYPSTILTINILYIIYRGFYYQISSVEFIDEQVFLYKEIRIFPLFKKIEVININDFKYAKVIKTLGTDMILRIKNSIYFIKYQEWSEAFEYIVSENSSFRLYMGL